MKKGYKAPLWERLIAGAAVTVVWAALGVMVTGQVMSLFKYWWMPVIIISGWWIQNKS